MSVLIDAGTRLLIQGIAGRFGRIAARELLAYGTKLSAGIAHGRPDTEIEGIPVFQHVRAACEATGADAAITFVPAVAALDQVIDAFEAGIRLVIYPGDGLPTQDAIEMRAAARANGAVLVGPNTPGVISPGKAKAGFMPSFAYTPGPLGVISRSGSLSYEVGHRLTSAGLGQTTVIGIGGDPVKGLTAAEALELLHADPETQAIVYLGEIGGTEEYDVARYARRQGAKPVAALIVGQAAPAGKKMGHAGALIGSYADTHPAKIKLLREAGAHTADTITQLVPAVRAALKSIPG